MVDEKLVSFHLRLIELQQQERKWKFMGTPMMVYCLGSLAAYVYLKFYI